MPARRDAPLAVAWFGDSSTLIELEGVRLMTDSILGQRMGPLVRIAPPVPSEPVRDITPR
jgi:L-ascorbate metabolism protein UlaG (beta-lactamase superfamily)